MYHMHNVCSKCGRDRILPYRFVRGNSPRIEAATRSTRTVYCKDCGRERVEQAQAEHRAFLASVR